MRSGPLPFLCWAHGSECWSVRTYLVPHASFDPTFVDHPPGTKKERKHSQSETKHPVRTEMRREKKANKKNENKRREQMRGRKKKKSKKTARRCSRSGELSSFSPSLYHVTFFPAFLLRRSPPPSFQLQRGFALHFSKSRIMR